MIESIKAYVIEIMKTITLDSKCYASTIDSLSIGYAVDFTLNSNSGSSVATLRMASYINYGNKAEASVDVILRWL